ncbi:hypothetical protein [Rhizobium sp. SSA_523]|uniref:hypothetical protein n=1 Tax=Rhizobium sp. SSA_523 TaxID=2952477 RepID=UPI0020911E7A|nr:hypothetical protein [Rhizobium sp. SSA_523]MCO5730147.1 hypothetical protein [Rhizobium sp. SSA_523]WKC25211.1 hypothetical protein QTJ18_14590 [Rhizobium sp. SSA_523]
MTAAPDRPARPKRKAIPDRVKLIAALRRIGLTITEVQFDHNPALELRPVNPHTGDTIPPANDPDHIDMLLLVEHKEKTFGRGGEKRATTADSDIGRIAKVRRLTKKQEEMRQRMLARSQGEKPANKSRWPKRRLNPRNNATKGKRHDRREDGPEDL